MMEPSGQTSRAWRLLLPCTLAAVRDAARAAHGFLAETGCTEEDIIDCELALVEACTNAVKYAGESARAVPVQLEILCSPGEVEIAVTDHTPGFDWPAAVPTPDLESENGRGIFLIQSVMQHSEYRRGQGENVLIMRRSRSCGKNLGG